MPGLEILRTNFQSFWDLDWSLVQFKEEYFVLKAAFLLLAAILLMLIRRWRRKEASYYEHSGYAISQQDRPGWSGRILGLIFGSLLLIGSGLILLAIADPYTVKSGQMKFEQSREIGYLRDTSISMGWKYKGTNLARAEIVQNFVLQLISSRREKKDRSFYLVFSGSPYLMADFTTDNQSLLFSAAVGPQVIADPSAPEQWPGKFIVKKFEKKDFEGGTDLAQSLMAALKIFEEKGKKEISEAIKQNPSLKRRSVIIITDGASETDPEPYLKELQKRSITPFLIFIDPDREAEVKLHGENSLQVKTADNLLKQIRRYGGESFLATDQAALDQIPQRLDLFYGLTAAVKVYTSERHIYRLPLSAGLIFFVLAAAARLVLWKFHRVV